MKNIKNPVYQIWSKRKPFIFFHTQAITREVLDAAVQARKSLEIDISISENGSTYVGHASSMYVYHHLPPPANLPLDIVIAEAKKAGLFLVLDCKDIRVLPKAKQIIKAYGAENCLLHACTEALEFRPYPEALQKVVEPQWPAETLPLEAILAVKKATGIPIALYSRGLSEERIRKDSDGILRKILAVAEGRAEVVVLHLPAGETLPNSFAKKMLQHGILPLFNIDHTPSDRLPPIFFGSTDILDSASNPNEFQPSKLSPARPKLY